MWLFNGEEVKHVVPGYYGFCYRITNLIDQRQYLGRKTFWFKRKNSKGTRITVESDWRDYYGSSQELLKDVEQYGHENFRREMLSFHSSKSDLNYSETKLIFQHNALEDGSYYNSNINGRYFKARMMNIAARSLFAS